MRKRASLSARPEADWGSSKSGYRHDIIPGEGPPDRTTIPVASHTGRQLGRPTPSERQYRAGVHEVVDAAEAVVRMKARLSGQLKPISHGLDDAPVPLTRRKEQSRSVIAPQAPIDDPASEIIDPDGMDAFEPGMCDIAGRSAEKQAAAQPNPEAYRRPMGVLDPNLTVPHKYLSQRRRIMLELTDTTLTVSAIDVIVNKYSVTVLLPQLTDGGTFIPRCGSELTITTADEAIGCYFPGAHFEIPQLKLIGLTFIRKEEGT